MAFSFQTVRYGWVALAGLTIVGNTIFNINNTRKQIKPVDVIELSLAIQERCMATQTSTNPVTYLVDPLSYTATWHSNVYTATNVTTYTNIVTNAIGWHIDRNMMAVLDEKIMELIPHYLDINDNTNYLTVTGLFAYLNIGDKTSQFTRTPAIETNVATYGEYPWQVYKEDLEERYKVLYYLQEISNSYVWVSNGIIRIYYNAPAFGGVSLTWGDGERGYQLVSDPYHEGVPGQYDWGNLPLTNIIYQLEEGFTGSFENVSGMAPRNYSSVYSMHGYDFE